jgi:bifunctional non-homologous end joining protein LigD
MEDIAAGKGRGPEPFITQKAGKGDGVWKTRPKGAALPAFVPPQLCQSQDRPPAGSGWAHEIKFDGYRMQLRVEAGAAMLRTRKGLDWTDRFAAIAEAGAALPDGLYDGEICALNDAGSPDFPALQAALADGDTDDLIFFVFDCLYADGEDLRPMPLSERKARLKVLCEALPKASLELIRYVDHFQSAGQAVLESACRMDLEGIVSKRMDAPYRSGRTEAWIKSKCRAGHEVVIGGWSGDDGRLRSLLVGVHREGQLVYLGRVGTGFGGETVKAILPRLLAAQAAVSPFGAPHAPRAEADVQWVRPELVAEIQYGGWTQAGILRQASFKGLREDKPANDVETVDPAPAAKTDLAEPAPRKAPPGRAVVMGVSLSNPDKALWPDGGDGQPVTKLDLAAISRRSGLG